MKAVKTLAFSLSLVASACLMSACSDSNNSQKNDYELSESFKVTYLSEMAQVGKSNLKIEITDLDGTPMEGLSPTLSPLMEMSTHNHSTPYGSFTESDEAGIYNATIYYLMASGPEMGTWYLDIGLPYDESVTFQPDVMMAMGDTARANLKSQTDTIANMMGGEEKRTYILFNDGLSDGDSGHDFSVFITTKESMMSFPAISAGQILNADSDYELTISSITVAMSTDPSDGDSWVTASNEGEGIWTAEGLTGLTDGEAGSIYVRLSVNGEQKTDDGNIPDGEYDEAEFVVTPSNTMMGM